MQRSHSRNSYPFDKRVPIIKNRSDGFYGYHNGVNLSFYRNSTSGIQKGIKSMHKKKQRQYDSSLVKNYFGSTSHECDNYIM